MVEIISKLPKTYLLGKINFLNDRAVTRIKYVIGASLFAIPPFAFVVSSKGITVPFILAQVCALVLVLFSAENYNSFVSRFRREFLFEAQILVAALCLIFVSLMAWSYTDAALVQFLKLLMIVALYFPLRALVTRSFSLNYAMILLYALVVSAVLILINNILFLYGGDNLTFREAVKHRHGITFLAILIIPTVLLLREAKQLNFFYGSMLVLPVLAIFTGKNQSAPLALVCASLIFFATKYLPRTTKWLTLGGILIFCFFIYWWIPLLKELGSLDSRSYFLDKGHADHRLSIWFAYLEASTYKFWFGWGHDAWRVSQILLQNVDSQLSQNINLKSHPHNGFIEVWYAYGMVGACLVTLFNLILVKKIWALPNDIRPYFAALFVAICVVVFVSHSLFQAWWLQIVMLAVVILFSLRQTPSQSEKTYS